MAPLRTADSQWAIVPDRFFAFEQKPSDEIGCRQVFMAGDGDQRPLKPPRHVFDKTRLAAAGRAFENYRQARGVGRFKQIDFPPIGR